MAPPRVASAKLAAALAAKDRGASIPEAAEGGGVSVATLNRALRARRGGPAGAAVPASTQAKPSKGPQRAGNETGQDDAPGDGDLLVTLRAELAHAMGKRKGATTDAAGEKWSKRVQSLADAVGRLQPPPPPSPDLIEEQLRRLDGEMVRRVEALQADPVDPKEIAA